MKYPVGTTYRRQRGRVLEEQTVVDYHVTRNLSGDIVKERYVTTHSLLGQTIYDYDITQTEIDRALWMPAK